MPRVGTPREGTPRVDTPKGAGVEGMEEVRVAGVTKAATKEATGISRQ